MSPTVLIADPSVRLAGVRTRRRPPVAARRRRRTVRWRWIVATWLAFAAACALAFLQTWPPLATVMSGSMAPTIDTGDVVLLKRLNRPARVGDVVSIPVPDEARARFGYPPVVIHRIVAIDAAGIVSTKGDARKEPDPFTVPATTLTTRVVATVPAAGRALAFMGSPLGLLWLGGGGILLIGLPLLDRSRDARRRTEEEREGLAAALTTLTAELAALRAEREDDADRERIAADAHQQALAEMAERDRAAAAAREAALAEAAERERLVAEAHQQALAEAAERERAVAAAHEQALAEIAERERAVAEAHAQAAEREQRLVAEAAAARDALARHLEELPALLARAIEGAFANAAPPPPPPPVPGRLVAASAMAPRAATPDLLACFAASPKPAWDAPPPNAVLMHT
jgi:signal peptidase I